jgi:hypothetical protein
MNNIPTSVANNVSFFQDGIEALCIVVVLLLFPVTACSIFVLVSLVAVPFWVPFFSTAAEDPMCPAINDTNDSIRSTKD